MTEGMGFYTKFPSPVSRRRRDPPYPPHASSLIVGEADVRERGLSKITRIL